MLGSATLAPTGQVESRDGGFVLNGQWHFHSGVLHSHWSVMAAMDFTAEGGPMPVAALVPTAQLENVDDWDTSGLRGTGSVSSRARKIFVPAQRVYPVSALTQGQSASRLNANAPIFQTPMAPTMAAGASATPLGLARAALATFFQRMPGRGITYTTYGKQAEAPITHFQVAEAAMKIDEAEFHAYRAADLVDAKAASREAWTLEERARVRMDAGMTVRLASIECRVVTEVTGGTHSVFLAEVHSAQATNGMPLTYFRGRMGHFAFMNTETEASLWRAMRWEDAI